MLKPLATLVLTLGLGTALAIEFPASAQLTFISNSGTVVAVGSLEEGNLSLDLLADFSGFVTIAGVDEEGNVVTFEATVEADGTITVLDMESFEFVNLQQAVAGAGGQVDISFQEEIEAQGDNGLDQALEVADEHAQPGLDRAKETQTVEVDSDDRERVDNDDTDQGADRDAVQDNGDGADEAADDADDEYTGGRR